MYPSSSGQEVGSLLDVAGKKNPSKASNLREGAGRGSSRQESCPLMVNMVV